MALDFIDYDQAIRNRNRQAHWTGTHSRLKPEAWPVIKPSFKLEPGAKIFTIGSCFARNIESHLYRLGYRVPTLELSSEYLAGGHDPLGPLNNSLNKYTPVSIQQEIAWAADLHRQNKQPDENDCEKFAYILKDGSVVDNNLAQFVPVTRERFLERRIQIFEIVRHVFSSDCVVITPGVVEAWYDAERQMYIQEVVTFRAPQITKNLQFTILDYETCLQALDSTIGLIRDFNPDTNFLITTSPIPLTRTFTDDDILVANTYAKSILRAACGQLASKRPGVDYFPSFESVTLTRDWGIMEEDLLHVHDTFIARIVARVAESYCTAPTGGEQFFQRSLEEADANAAIGLIRQAIARAPDIAAYHMRLGQLLLQIDKLGEAEEAIRQAEANSEPGLLELGLHDIADRYLQKGDVTRARNLLGEAMGTGAAPIKVLGRLGYVCLQLNDLTGAEAAYRKILEIHPAGIHTYFRLTDTLRRMNRHSEAIEIAKQGLEYDPRNESLHMLMGVCYRALDDDREAESCFRRVLDMDPEHASAQGHVTAIAKRRQSVANKSRLA